MRALWIMVAGFGLAGCLPLGNEPPASETGAELYGRYCAACHGPDGRARTDAARAMRPQPTDLTRLSAKSGGVYPAVGVMGKIYGYSLGRGSVGPMPEFGPLMEGRTVLIETAPGIATPTPERLVLIAEYLRGLQD